eukprot:Gregarina_sp_Poly_1__1740@NODE_1449_length_4125_cov_205_179892_g961_i0_p2_GENE_NODE_1449_length_4125_cov_205_179892_g961_i0NODE_1449_length_4125_cov_205_179892_g961_i0_p2_ORF_typecomplete_len387_score76_14DUF2659/PF10858_8/0_2Hid1/PF12722_7/5_5_NODE_1449_length_4125_cov_205_179892_g961_i027923952
MSGDQTLVCPEHFLPPTAAITGLMRSPPSLSSSIQAQSSSVPVAQFHPLAAELANFAKPEFFLGLLEQGRRDWQVTVQPLLDSSLTPAIATLLAIRGLTPTRRLVRAQGLAGAETVSPESASPPPPKPLSPSPSKSASPSPPKSASQGSVSPPPRSRFGRNVGSESNRASPKIEGVIDDEELENLLAEFVRAERAAADIDRSAKDPKNKQIELKSKLSSRASSSNRRTQPHDAEALEAFKPTRNSSVRVSDGDKGAPREQRTGKASSSAKIPATENLLATRSIRGPRLTKEKAKNENDRAFQQKRQVGGSSNSDETNRDRVNHRVSGESSVEGASTVPNHRFIPDPAESDEGETSGTFLVQDFQNHSRVNFIAEYVARPVDTDMDY